MNFFWLHIKKASGQSMRAGLSDVYVQTDRAHTKPFIALPKEQWNDAINNYRVPLGEYDFHRMQFVQKFLYTQEEFERLFKFVIVRNPYARAVSCWKSLNPKISFNRFVEQIPKQWKLINTPRYRHIATHTTPVIPDITDDNGNLLVNFIGKLETISKDFRHICQRLDIKERPYPFVNRGSTTKKYMDYYNRQTREVVTKLYKEDIERLGYQWGK